MGGSKSKPGIYIKTEKTFYLPSQIVQGCVYINAQQPYPTSKIVLSILGLQKIWWKHRQGQNPQNSIPTQNQSMNQINRINPHQANIPLHGDRFGQIKIIQTSFILNNTSNSAYKLHGQYAFPFQFQLPSFIPGSFRQQQSNFKASVNYQLQCRIISAKSNLDEVLVTQQLIIRQPKKNNQQSLFGQVYLYPQTCCCFKNGVSRVCCYFQKNQYVPGQQCIAICQADNYKCKLNINNIKVVFKKVVTLTSSFGEDKMFVQEINRASFPGVGAFGQYTGNQAKKITIPLKYRGSKQSIPPTTNGRLVKCSYYLTVIPQLSGWFLKNAKSFQVNLNILHEGLTTIEQVQKPQNWNPEVYRKSEIMLNQNFSNQFIDNMGNKNYF